jgi:uncharacterized membrane protein
VPWNHAPERRWPIVLAAILLIAAHAAVFGLAFRTDVSLTLLAAVAGLLALKYAWSRHRR